MVGWMTNITDCYLRAVYGELHRKLLTAKLIHSDETSLILIYHGDGPKKVTCGSSIRSSTNRF